MMNESQHAATGSRKYSASSMSSGAPDPPIMRPEEEEEDRQLVQKIKTTLRYYHKYANSRVFQTECYLNSLPKRHQSMLAKYRNHLGVVRDCIEKNQSVIKKMLRKNFLLTSTVEEGEIADTPAVQQNNDTQASIKVRHQDMEHAQSTLKLIARDWSSEGAAEREQSYKPIIDAIEKFYKPSEFELNEIKILVPGAGLGRLTYELACRGYECEGNEFSYFMLIASNFVLNYCTEENEYTLYPWLHQYANNLRMADQVAGIHFPDVCPAKNPPKGNISIAAGDFLNVYKEPNAYNCVATCFFIDCGNNVVDFIETIYRILVPGGIWVNLGPLLYHFSDVQNQQSIEPTYENLVLIIEMVGFEILSNETGVRTKYAQNPKSMLKSEYESLFWVCRKPLHSTNHDYANEGNSDNEMDGDTDGSHNDFDKYRH